jgi:hypothetical protein
LQPWKRSQEDWKHFTQQVMVSNKSRNHPWFISKVISNYTNHIANTPVDAAFQNLFGQKNNSSLD